MGLPLTACAVATASILLHPVTLVQTRVVSDAAGLLGRAALAQAALQLQPAPGQSVLLDDQGSTLLINVTGEDSAAVLQHARSVANTVLDMPHANLSQPAANGHLASAPRQDSPAAAGHTAAIERSRLQAALDGIESRLASASASLTGVTRDLAASARAAAERKPVRDTLDKAAATLADLQVQRIQMQSRYQDDYPALLVLDGQIRSMRTYLQDEARRAEATAHIATPADSVLTSERERLRAELSILSDRRAVAVAELAAATQVTAGAVPAARTAEPEQAVVHPAPISDAVLLEAATTVIPGADYRWAVVPALGLTGVMLALFAWVKPSRQVPPAPTYMLLERIEALLRSQEAMSSLSGGGFPALAQPVFSTPFQAFRGDRLDVV